MMQFLQKSADGGEQISAVGAEVNCFLCLTPEGNWIRGVYDCCLAVTIQTESERERERENKRTRRNGCLSGDGYEGYDKLMTTAYAGSWGSIS